MRLLEAARSQIAEKGVSGLRINEITEAADVALGSFYNHFESKEAIVEAIVADSLQELAETLATGALEDPAELVSAAIRQFVGLAYDDPEFARLVVHLDHADALFARAVHPAARRAVDVGIASGRFDVDNVEVAVTVILGGSLHLMRGIIDGRTGAGAQDAWAELALRLMGLDPATAAEVARRPLTPVAKRTIGLHD
ncbi:MAG: TetR/AcrR family transcriptional regulator [Actinomycetota bacterium]|nr:TetR/AcrR family transcriptional regulator [Actinomycetota bacterium]